MIVVDVNILAHYVIQGERTEHVHRLWALDDGWIVPFFWRVEFQSILWKCVRSATYRTKGKDGARRKPAPRKQNRQTKPA